MAGTVVIDLTAKDNVSATLNKVNTNANKLNKTFTDSRGKLRNAQGQFVKMGKAAGTARQSFKLLGTTFATYLAPLVAFGTAVKAVGASLTVFSERQKDTQALANGIKGMTTDGNAALASLKKSADELGKATLFNEEDFTKGFKLLTSFKTIGVSSYDDVASTAADMATVLDQDVNSVLLQVAKALEAPEVGLTALQRSGTRFTDSQKRTVKAMVKANKTADAQAFILKELNRQYGGASLSAAKGFAGAMDTLGELTRDAGEAIGEFVAPAIIAGVKLLSKGIEGLGRFFNYLSATVFPAAQKAFQPLIDSFRKIFSQIDFQAVGNIITNVLVGGFELLFNAASKITPVIAGIVETMFNMLKNTPFGLMVQGIMKVAEFLGLTKPKMDEFAASAKEVNTEFKDMPVAVDAVAEAQKRKVAALQQGLELVKEETSNIKKQEQAFENAVKVSQARLGAEVAINRMQNQGLQIAYEQATSAKKRLEIAKQIFLNEVQGAKLAFDQTMLSIKAEAQRLQFRKEAAIIEAKMIQAEGELAAAKEKSSEKAALILEKTRNAVAVQRESVQLIDGQIKAQKEVAKFQIQAAKAQVEMSLATAGQNLEQKLVSKEIGMSVKGSRKFVQNQIKAARKTFELKDATSRVAGNAKNAAFQFIKVAEKANAAAIKINNAAIAQERFNRAKAGSTSGGKGKSVKMQAQGGYNKGAFKAFAQGGVVTGPTLGLIGEGGEPEYIIPESKAAGFAANYISGQRGAKAIPGFAEGGYVGPVNITTGPVMQQDGTNYVTMAQFEAGIRDVASAVTRSGRSYGSRRFTGIS